MKKVFQMLMVVTVLVATAASVGFVATPCASAGTDIVSMDKAVGTNSVVTGTMSSSYTAKPVWLNAYNLYPTGGTAIVTYHHTDALGAVKTNTLAAITDSDGAISSNLTGLVTQYIFKREPVFITFSAATNGAVQLVGELYGIGK